MTPSLLLVILCGISTFKSLPSAALSVKRQDDQVVTKMFRVEDKTYNLILERKGWQSARAACQDLGGDLASPISYSEFDGIVAAIRSVRIQGPLPEARCFWIGAYRRRLDYDYTYDLKNDWYWITGQHLSPNYAKWHHKDLDDHPEDKYAIIDADIEDTPEGDLRSWYEDKQLPFLCEV